nr:MAG TPA: hypothetical protein [Caudoviricetes sp.]
MYSTSSTLSFCKRRKQTFIHSLFFRSSCSL